MSAYSCCRTCSVLLASPAATLIGMLLGYLIWNSWQLFIPEKLYVGLVVIGLIGALVTALLSRSEKLLLPWRRER